MTMTTLIARLPAVKECSDACSQRIAPGQVYWPPSYAIVVNLASLRTTLTTAYPRGFFSEV